MIKINKKAYPKKGHETLAITQIFILVVGIVAISYAIRGGIKI